MRRWWTGVAVFVMLVAAGWAKPPIVEVAATPRDGVGEKSSWHKPLVIKSQAEAAKHFAEAELKKLVAAVDFEQQFVLVFAWQGSGGDELSYEVAESDPEQITFLLKPGMTRDLRRHQQVYTLRANVQWRVAADR